MNDEFTLTLDSPITEEQWDMIADVDFDYTNEITFHTKYGKEVKFVKASAQPEPQWIPCSEKLPKEGQMVLITDNGEIDFGMREDGEWLWLCESGTDYWAEIGNVDAWMPLPEPYKGEQK